MKTSSRLNLPRWLIALGLATILPAAMLVLSAQTSLATNYTWDLNPGEPNGCGNEGDGNWHCADNWMPEGFPGGNNVGDTATFGVSNVTNISTLDGYYLFEEVDAIGFAAGASAFTITFGIPMQLTGTGITNNSGVTQNFVIGGVGFSNSATAGSNTTFTNNYGGNMYFGNTSSAGSATIINGNMFTTGGYIAGAVTEFDNTTTASSATITNNGTTFSGGVGGGRTYFGGPQPSGEASSAGSATITNNGATISTDPNNGGETIFGYYNYACTSTAGSATIINNGATISSGVGGETHFFKTTTAGSATLIANGGTGGARVVPFSLRRLPLAAWHAWRFSATAI